MTVKTTTTSEKNKKSMYAIKRSKRETESLLSAALEQALTPTQLKRSITRMCQTNVDYADHMGRTFYTFPEVATC